jgi:hypothetical protein
MKEIAPVYSKLGAIDLNVDSCEMACSDATAWVVIAGTLTASAMMVRSFRGSG